MKSIQRAGRFIIIKALLTAGLAVFCLGVWPGYLIHTEQKVDLYPQNVWQTQWLFAGDVAEQSFSPVYGRLLRIKAAVVFDESAVDGEYLQFTLYDDTGKKVSGKKIYFDEIESRYFFDIAVGKKLDPGRIYTWTLTMPDETELQYALFYTEEASGIIIENSMLSVNGESTQGIAVNQYDYYAHYDKSIIVGKYWTGAVLIWLLLLELTDRAAEYFKRKEHGEVYGSVKEI